MPTSRRTLRLLGVDLRPGEGAPAGLLFAALFCLITFQVATESVRQSTFIHLLGAERLPLVYLLVAVAALPVLALWNRFAGAAPPRRLLVGTCGLVGLSLPAFWVLFAAAEPWVAVLFYVWVTLGFALLVSVFWSVVNHRFDPRQAKRLFGFIGAGGLLGGIAGGQLARWVAPALGTRALLLVATGFLFAAGLVALRAVGRQEAEPAGRQASRGSPPGLQGGLRAVWESRHLRLVAGLMLCSLVVAQIVDLQFNWGVQETVDGLDRRTAVFGNFYTAVGVVATLFQLLATGRILQRFGVGGAIRALPVTMGVGTAALLLSGMAAPGAVFSVVVALKIGENGLRFSLDQAARELLFMPVPARVRVRAKAFLDVFFQRGAKGLGALALLPVTFGWMTPLQASWLAGGVVIGWLVVARAMHREHVRSYRRRLADRRAIEPLAVDLRDPGTLEVLMRSLASADSRHVLQSLELLGEKGRGDLVPPLLLFHDDAEVRCATLRCLAAAGRRDALPLIERRLVDDNPEVRAEALRVLAGLQGRGAAELLLPRLEEGEAQVRAAAVAGLAELGGREVLERAAAALDDLMSDASPAVRSEAARAIGAVVEPTFQERLVRLLYDPEPAVAREAIAAVRRRVARDGFNPLYAPTLIARLQDRRLKQDAREALEVFGEAALPALEHFMNDADEPIWVRRALPKTIARLGSKRAAETLIEALARARDRMLRRKLIEGLSAMEWQAGPKTPEQAGLLEQLRLEAERYQECLLALAGLGLETRGSLEGPLVVWREAVEPNLLERLLAERMGDHLWKVFGLLATLHPAQGIWAAYRSLVYGPAPQRAHALEYLDNLLSGDLRREVFLVLDDSPLVDRLASLRLRLEHPPVSRADALRRFLAVERAVEPDEAALTAAALYCVHSERMAGLEAAVAELATAAAEPLVRETALWVAARQASRAKL